MKPWDARIAYALVHPLRDTKITPNHITTLRLLVGLSAAVAFAVGRPAWSSHTFHFTTEFKVSTNFIVVENAETVNNRKRFTHRLVHLIWIEIQVLLMANREYNHLNILHCLPYFFLDSQIC